MSRRAGDSESRSSGLEEDEADDDAAAFALAVVGVRRLGGVVRISPLDGKNPGVRSRPSSVVQATGSPSLRRGLAATPGSAPGTANLMVEDSGDVWTVRADGVDRRVLRKLRAGDVAVEGRLDLHGLTRARALQALDRFVVKSRGAGQRCLLVIHGRGLHSGMEGPTLRDAVRTELTAGAHARLVMACCSAPPKWGGAGAMLVLFRR